MSEKIDHVAQSITAMLDALDAAEAREQKLREALATIKTAAENVRWNADRDLRAAGAEYDRCWEHVAGIANVALAETAP